MVTTKEGGGHSLGGYFGTDERLAWYRDKFPVKSGRCKNPNLVVVVEKQFLSLGF